MEETGPQGAVYMCACARPHACRTGVQDSHIVPLHPERLVSRAAFSALAHGRGSFAETRAAQQLQGQGRSRRRPRRRDIIYRPRAQRGDSAYGMECRVCERDASAHACIHAVAHAPIRPPPLGPNTMPFVCQRHSGCAARWALGWHPGLQDGREEEGPCEVSATAPQRRFGTTHPLPCPAARAGDLREPRRAS